MSDTATILWRRVDTPGHEVSRLAPDGDGWVLAGSAMFAHEGQPCRLYYSVTCDHGFRTQTAAVQGWVGDHDINVTIEAEGGRWRLNGVECPQVEGCIDVDLNFSPSTNLLPIRRLDLAIGDEAEVRAAWLRFPEFVLEPLPQVYRRTGRDTYHYESGGGAFVAELEVDVVGFVSRYAGLFEEVAY
ncbi:MAG TPA: putative glycolipid-binding domain-containing protein [Longimicrobium sp.]|nr:putative glycolipid-binding domain-containing protein [Longimicrobium sp.]